MKKFALLVFVMIGSQTLRAQNLVLKTSEDSLSYVLGEFVGFKLMEQGLGSLKITNTTAFMQALNDIVAKKKPMIDDAAANACLNTHLVKMQAEKADVQIEAGKKFLDQNKLRTDVKTTASGLQYEVIKEGKGIKPTAVDTFVAHYRGTLLNGTEFDASYNRNQPLVMALTDVITGWKEGLQLMAVGSKYKFYIPYNLAYGKADNGQIPAGSMLIFDLELLDVKKRKTQ